MRTLAFQSLSLRTMTLETIAHCTRGGLRTYWRDRARIIIPLTIRSLSDANKLSKTGGHPCLSTSMPIPAASRSLAESPCTDHLRNSNDRYRVYGVSRPNTLQVIEGAVHKLLSDGRRQIGAFHLAGDIFGLENGAEHRFTAEAIVDTTVRLMKRCSLEHVAESDAMVALDLLNMTTSNLQHAEDHMLLLGRKTSLERVAAFLLEMDRAASLPPASWPFRCAVAISPISRSYARDSIPALSRSTAREFSVSSGRPSGKSCCWTAHGWRIWTCRTSLRSPLHFPPAHRTRRRNSRRRGRAPRDSSNAQCPVP